jgi:hypothetical protein
LEYLKPHLWDSQIPITYMIPEFRRQMEAEDKKIWKVIEF